MSLRYSIRILDHLSHRDYAPVGTQEMARQLRVASADFEEFRATLESLEANGRLELGDDDRWRLPDLGDEVVGVYRQNVRGFGFVEPDHPTRRGSLFIPAGFQGDAISGDRVRAEVNRRDRAGGRSSARASGRGAGTSGGHAGGGAPAGRIAGRVVEVLQRGRDEFVGTLTQRGRQWIVEPDGRSLRAPVVVRDPFAKNAKRGDKVVFELTRYPEDDAVGEGVIVRVLGAAGAPDVETQAVIAAHGLRQEFPPEAIDDARMAALQFDREVRAATEAHGAATWADREDLTEQFIFTIDPPDAKDYDDAISIEHIASNGHWRLGVHIADVSHFVPPGSALDEEARARGNSVYLPRLVLPMLPEALSNGVCSLQEGVVRFTKSAFIEFDAKGRVESQRLASTVIRSAKRLTYLEAQALIDGRLDEARRHAKTEPSYTDQLIDALRSSDRLARVLERRRKHEGMLTLDLPAVELEFDDEGHVVDAHPEDNAYTHKLIEMFMVEANEALARTFADLDLPLIRRIHPEPTFADVENLRMYARLAQWRLPDEPTRQDIQALLEATRGTPAARAIHFAVLRTFTKATYSPALIGHFALASEHYTHFTSPIRRYPDLTVHRAMQAYLDETGNGTRRPGGRERRAMARRVADDERVLSEDQLLELGRHCSETEVAAEEAEQELRSFLVLQLLKERHLGDEFEAIVTHVTPNAVFVSLQRFLVDGMAKVVDLGAASGKAQRWLLNDATGRLVAARSGASIGLGDLVAAQIVQVDLPSRTLELRITRFAEQPGSGLVADDSNGSAPRRGSGARGPSAGGRREQDVNRRKSAGEGRAHGHKRGFKSGRRGRKGR
ncbi:MAG: VacB/RNase II family 3'-5' exoribonuclease [Phycisphaerales bacterium]